jgi:hypothetical protein
MTLNEKKLNEISGKKVDQVQFTKLFFSQIFCLTGSSIIKEFWHSQTRKLREPKMLVLKKNLFKVTINNQFCYIVRRIIGLRIIESADYCNQIIVIPVYT